jgi:anti-sigma B factor antagonist
MRALELEVIHRGTGDCSVLVVSGAVDTARCRRFDRAVTEALATKPRRLVIDLRGAQLVDSMGLAVLVDARRRALHQRIELKLVCDVPSALRVLALTGLDHAFDVHPTCEGALGTTDTGEAVSTGLPTA